MSPIEKKPLPDLPCVRWFCNDEAGALLQPDREVHLWTWKFRDIRNHALHASLRLKETLCEKSFATPALRERYAAAHGKLRSLLGRYLCCAPGDIEIITLPWGKPCLLRERLFFNMSHTDERVVIAISTKGPVGMDVEELRPVPEASIIARRWFSFKEVRWIESHNEPNRAFLRCWVRREALLKGVGTGITTAISSLELPAPPHPSPCKPELEQYTYMR